MKKWLSVLLALSVLWSLAACSGGEGKRGESTTLMIYMVGSDLEAKSAAGSDDLTEIKDSGIDTGSNNVLIMTGGTPAWHNDVAGKTENTIIKLTSDGYEQEKSLTQTSMGEAETLTAFLDYCVENNPAEHYALILWNHGNGPLIGYGKDILFQNDSLTLAEMEAAMQASSFGKDKKLDWVGFDACLMASAELACVWDDYADYLIASQEVEPAFGWTYDFLLNLGKEDTHDLVNTLTDHYLAACLDYFEKKGYDDRDTTLACLDLSHAEELQSAVNGLFGAASGDIGTRYDALAARRVNTRALGRASTGSEYDLVDLRDLSEQLKADYPEQTAALSGVIDEMVVKNATNATGLSGLSLYYPFYNKDYYEKSWKQTYADLNIFPEYVGFLSEYEKTWLKSDMTDGYTTGGAPAQDGENQYTLKLTDDQAKHFASAKYYVLRRAGGETFQKVYSSADVTNSGGTLTANFDGNVIYAKNDLEQYIMPVTTEHDTVGSITNYSVPVTLDDAQGGSFLYSGDAEVNYLKSRFVIAADKSKSNIAVSALLPYDTEQSGSDLLGGKAEEINTDDYVTYLFMSEDPRTIVRDDNGVIQAVDKWLNTGYHDWNELAIADGLAFIYAPLTEGSYALVFEICDTQGNLYCSEPVDVKVSGTELRKPSAPKVTTVSSDGTYPLLLKEDDTAAVYLEKAEDVLQGSTLTLRVTNKSDKKIKFRTDELVCNDTISCMDKVTPMGEVEPNATLASTVTFDFGDARDIGALKSLSKLHFTISISDYESKKTLWNNEHIQVDFQKGKEFVFASNEVWGESKTLLEETLAPLNGASVKAQTIAEDSEKKIELLCFGKKEGSFDDGTLTGAYRVTNLSDHPLYITSDGLSVDNIFVPVEAEQRPVAVGTEAYMDFSIDISGKYGDNLAAFGVTGMQAAKVNFRTASGRLQLWQGYGENKWYDIALATKSASPSKLPAGSKVLLDENDVKVTLLGYDTDGNSSGAWKMAVENKRSEGVLFRFKDLSVNGKAYEDGSDTAPVYWSPDKIGPKQSGVIMLNGSSLTPVDITAMQLRFVVCDFTGSKILFEGSKTVELTPD